MSRAPSEIAETAFVKQNKSSTNVVSDFATHTRFFNAAQYM